MAAVSPWRPVATLAPMILRIPCSSPPLGTPGACRLNRVAKPGFGTATLTTGVSTGGPTTPGPSGGNACEAVVNPDAISSLLHP